VPGVPGSTTARHPKSVRLGTTHKEHHKKPRPEPSTPPGSAPNLLLQIIVLGVGMNLYGYVAEKVLNGIWGLLYWASFPPSNNNHN
jgi:hypothetical protein